MTETYKKARSFVYRNARPLDFARWRYHFEGGSREEVLSTLAAYQNADGGFGHALEPDYWNPDSTPTATWAATNILREVGLRDPTHPIVQGILLYLDSGKDFVGGKWCTTVPGNNDHPHAVWWTCNDKVGVPSNNPTASLCGFALYFADASTPLFKKAAEIAAGSVAAFLEAGEEDSHTLNNFLDLLYYCEQIPGFSLFDLDTFRTTLYQAVNGAACVG